MNIEHTLAPPPRPRPSQATRLSIYLVSAVHICRGPRRSVTQSRQKQQRQSLQPTQSHQSGQERVGDASAGRQRREVARRRRQRGARGGGPVPAPTPTVTVARKGAHLIRRERGRLETSFRLRTGRCRRGGRCRRRGHLTNRDWSTAAGR